MESWGTGEGIVEKLRIRSGDLEVDTTDSDGALGLLKI